MAYGSWHTVRRIHALARFLASDNYTHGIYLPYVCVFLAATNLPAFKSLYYSPSLPPSPPSIPPFLSPLSIAHLLPHALTVWSFIMGSDLPESAQGYLATLFHAVSYVAYWFLVQLGP
ncbi:hypothetical protein C8Q74DRAFT_1304234 [Fomes fomentarius]|nr:hypothetical protein C8Q74DRAFT_1304234 [Fomes fomentarius]